MTRIFSPLLVTRGLSQASMILATTPSFLTVSFCQTSDFEISLATIQNSSICFFYGLSFACGRCTSENRRGWTLAVFYGGHKQLLVISRNSWVFSCLPLLENAQSILCGISELVRECHGGCAETGWHSDHVPVPTYLKLLSFMEMCSRCVLISQWVQTKCKSADVEYRDRSIFLGPFRSVLNP